MLVKEAIAKAVSLIGHMHQAIMIRPAELDTCKHHMDKCSNDHILYIIYLVRQRRGQR
jgi:hypothetical protein